MIQKSRMSVPTFDVIDPATGEPFAQAPAVTREQLDTAVRAAHAAFAGWRRDDAARRRALLAAADATEAGQAAHFHAPTILADVSDGLAVVDEEQFGPAMPVIAYRDVGDAVARPRERLRPPRRCGPATRAARHRG